MSSVDIRSELIADQRSRLQDIHRRMAAAIRQLDDDAVNWRPNEQSNSIANLVLHVCGNLGQRVVSAIGGAPDVRDRDREFASRERLTTGELLDRLRATFDAADGVFAGLDPGTLLDAVDVRGQQWTRLKVINQTVAHGAEHLGQVVYIAKMRLGADYAFLTIPPPGGRKAEV